jgi:glutathione-regulated potassium-efflux system protein KefB
MDIPTSAIPLPALVFLAAAVIAPTLFQWLRLGTITGFLAAGMLIGPAGAGVFSDPEQVLHLAELGVVMLLFVIGLEMNISRLFAMKTDIIGLGLAQVGVTSAMIAALLWATGLFSIGPAVAVGFALSLSSTALAVRLLDDRGDLMRPYGQRSFAVLLAQDMALVPALALIPALSGTASLPASPLTIAIKVGVALGVFAAIVVSGKYLIDPVLRYLARSGARESMIAVALLLVMGAAWAAELVGLSMALGAFLAGLLLAKSTYRHEIEANIEPFRGLLLALFFMGVGMSIDVRAVIQYAHVLAAGLFALLALKLIIGMGLVRMRGSPWHEALRVSALLAPTSEFAFVLLPLIAAHGLIDKDVANTLAALGALSMLVSPLLIKVLDKMSSQWKKRMKLKVEPVANFDGVEGKALLIGFGRFGQIAAMMLESEGISTVLIDNNAERIKNAERFGFKVYYGDGSRTDVLRSAGAGDMGIIMVCVANPDQSMRMVNIIQHEFPLARLAVRSYDRAHSIALQEVNVELEVRETYESAILFGRSTLELLGLSPERARFVEEDVRKRDLERFQRQRAEGLMAGMDLLHQKTLQPQPIRDRSTQ